MQQPSPHHETTNPVHYERLEYHHSRVMIGVSHILRMAGSLSPLLILEFVKEPNQAHRWIKAGRLSRLV